MVYQIERFTINSSSKKNIYFDEITDSTPLLEEYSLKISKIFKENYGDSYAYKNVYSPKNWGKVIEDEEKKVFGFFDNQELVGVLTSERLYNNDTPIDNVFEIGKYALLKEVQGTGISQSFANKVIPAILNSGIGGAYIARNRTDSATTQYATEIGGMIPTAILGKVLPVPNGLETSITHSYSNWFNESVLTDLLDDGPRSEDEFLTKNLKKIDLSVKPVRKSISGIIPYSEENKLGWIVDLSKNLELGTIYVTPKSEKLVQKISSYRNVTANVKNVNYEV